MVYESRSVPRTLSLPDGIINIPSVLLTISNPMRTGARFINTQKNMRMLSVVRSQCFASR